MRYERQGPFSIPGQKFAIVASVLNTLEDFLALFPVEKPYQRYGPFVNDGPPPFTTGFFNGIEDCLSQIQAEKSYQPWDPYVNESGPPVWRILDHIEDFLVTLNQTYREEANEYGEITRTYADPTSSQQESKKCPICGGWKDFGDAWLDTSIGLCPGHGYLKAFQAIGDSQPRGWYDKAGNFYPNKDYIAPPGRAEPAQYEQALVDYEQITKDEQ